MRRARSGPGMAEFLHYYLLVLLTKESRTKRELIEAIKQESIDNRSYRAWGAVWVASTQMDKSLSRLEEEGLIRCSKAGRWQITSSGRKARATLKKEHEGRCITKENAADELIGMMTPPAAGERVLDVGTGEGFLSFKVAERGSSVLGIDSGSFDYSKDSIKKAKDQAQSHGGTIEFRQADVARLSKLNSSFDYVVSSQAIHCMKDQRICLLAIYDLLKPGGHFLCLDFGVGLKGFLCHDFHSFLALSRVEWARLLPEFGFKDVRIDPVGGYLVINAQKPLDDTGGLASSL